MNNPIPIRRAIAALAVLIALAIPVALLSACDPVSRDWAWTAGKTHGALIETTAGRASLEIYRAPTDGLYQVYIHSNLDQVQNMMWRLGKPPQLRKTFTYRGRSLTLEFGSATTKLKALTKKLIYDDDQDLFEGLVNAHFDRNCLALTLLSAGRPTSNWTNKSAGCQQGSIPRVGG